MNGDSVEWLRYYVQIVRKESSWGRSQSLQSYKNYILLESDELRLAMRLGDYMNIREELADVYMMLEFYYQEIADHLCPDPNHKQAIHFKKELLKLASSYSFSEAELAEVSCTKLARRYPYLLPYQQMAIDDEYWDEEFLWEAQKNYYKMLEFCTCLTVGCENYHKAYDGRNLFVKNSSSGKKSYIVCRSCHKRVPLSKAVLFYGSNQDYKVALRAVVEYLNTQEKERVCEQYGLKPKMLAKLVQRCQDNLELFNYIAKSRYRSAPQKEAYEAVSFKLNPASTDD